MPFELRFNVVFKKAGKMVAEAEGVRSNLGSLTVSELSEQIRTTEKFLEAATGLVVVIEQQV